jgi:GNAT superfamily N-acetyltransferase
MPVPLQDWPNHIAGSHVLAALLAGDPFWERFYRLNTFLVPDAAVDVGLLGLRRLGVPEALAANIFVFATYFICTISMIAVSRSLRAYDATKPALAVLLFYAVPLFWGLVNYVLAVGLMWGALALWLRRRDPIARLAVAAAAAAVLLFVHVIPAVAFGLLLGCFDAARWRAGASPRSCVSGPVALAVALVTLRLLPGHTGDDLGAVYAGAGSVAAFALWKLRVFATLPLGGGVWRDAVSAVAWLGAAAAIGLAARPRLAFGPALGVAALVLLVLAVPERLGTGSLLDVRLAILPLMLAAMAVRPRWRGAGAARACLAVVTLVTLARTGLIAAEWRRAADVFAAYDAQAATLPPGGLMVMGYGRPRADITWANTWSPPIQSIAAQVVRHGVFFPALFANPDQQPIARRPQFNPLGQPWNFSDPAHRAASLTALRGLCDGGMYTGVFVTVLYGPTPFTIVDACQR